MASLVYPYGRSKFADGTYAWGTSTFKVMFVGSGYTPSAAHQYVSSANSYELSGSGYVGGFNGSGRKTITSKSVSVDTDNNRVYLKASDDLTWDDLNAGTIAGIIIIKENTSDADSHLIAYLDNNDLLTSGKSVVVQWDTSGLFYF